MKNIVSLIILLSGGLNLFGQDYYDRFKALLSSEDTLAQRALLSEWESKSKNDPELAVSYFNFYIYKSMREIVRLDNNPRGEESLQITDSTGNAVGFMYSEIEYEPESIQKAFDVINAAIIRNPNRLDMRFGKTHMLGKLERFDAFTAEIVQAVQYSAKNKNKWLWSRNEPVKDGRNFLLDNIQNYIGQLYERGDAVNMRTIANAVIKLHPDHVVSLSNLGISYLLEEDYKSALVPFLKAEKKSPHDGIVLANIAYVYAQVGDNRNAKVYYEKVIQHGDEELREFARTRLNEL